MHDRYYLIKAAILALALVTIGANAGPSTLQISNEITQAHASTLHFMSVTAASIRCGFTTALNHILQIGR